MKVLVISSIEFIRLTSLSPVEKVRDEEEAGGVAEGAAVVTGAASEEVLLAAGKEKR